VQAEQRQTETEVTAEAKAVAAAAVLSVSSPPADRASDEQQADVKRASLEESSPPADFARSVGSDLAAQLRVAKARLLCKAAQTAGKVG
jgi:hypothetical protein